MKPTDFWKNFKLGEELSVSGAFIYNGLRRFHELQKLDHADDLFEVFYCLAIGFERLLKVAVVLLEHDDSLDQMAFEKSLITHNHQELLRRIKKYKKVTLGATHNDLLTLLGTFYRQIRYGRFCLESSTTFDREQRQLCAFLGKHLNVHFPAAAPPFGITNEDRYRRFLRRTALKVSTALYAVVQERARELNLYTYELRHGSKAETVFLGEADMPAEDVLWKELLLFFMNTRATSGYLEFLRGIPALDFDPALVDDYLACFQSDAAKSEVLDELSHHYEELENKSERIQLISVVGAQNVFFPDDDYGEESDIDIEPRPD